eukprot:4462883-Prymnesium_polylepis.2
MISFLTNATGPSLRVLDAAHTLIPLGRMSAREGSACGQALPPYLTAVIRTCAPNPLPTSRNPVANARMHTVGRLG